MSFHLDHRHGPHAFEMMAHKAFALIPEPFAGYLRDIIVRVKDFADDETLDALGIENEWGLSGLYHGRPVGEQSIWSSGDLPPVITLYRMPLLAEWRQTGVKLEDLVAHVVIHEVGHHFGLSDAEMAALERAVG
jgi:predicted Zn-dependent protease with MMP-like domain